MRKDASALRNIFGPLREVSLDEIAGEPMDIEPANERGESVLGRRLAGGCYDRSREVQPGASHGDRCDGCRRAVPLVCTIDMRTAAARVRRRRYCGECAKLIGDWKPPPHESA
jgi:hypothetical protein